MELSLPLGVQAFYFPGVGAGLFPPLPVPYLSILPVGNPFCDPSASWLAQEASAGWSGSVSSYRRPPMITHEV